MSNDKLGNILDSYMLHCGINWWDAMMEREEGSDRRYLDNHLKGTSQSQKRMRFVIGG